MLFRTKVDGAEWEGEGKVMIRMRLEGCSRGQDMSVRAGILCSAPDSAFNSPLFHLAAS